MTQKKHLEDETFRNLLRSSRTEIPFPELEDDIMSEIEQIDAQKDIVREGYSKGLKLAGVFFLIGLICGLILTRLLPALELTLPGIDSSMMLIGFQMAFAIVTLLLLEKLYLHWKKMKELY